MVGERKMSFTKMWDKNLIGKSIMVYLTNRRRYSGELKDFGDTFVTIDKIMFNPDNIISMSEYEPKETKERKPHYKNRH